MSHPRIVGLSLHQPYADLIAHQHKLCETRSWSTPYRGLVAIHAAKVWTDDQRALWATHPTANHLVHTLGDDYVPTLGAFVAVADFRSCVRMTPAIIDRTPERERALGLWTPGRFAWWLADARPLVEPVAYRGRQRLFDIDDETTAQLWQSACDACGSLALCACPPGTPTRAQSNDDDDHDAVTAADVDAIRAAFEDRTARAPRATLDTLRAWYLHAREHWPEPYRTSMMETCTQEART